MKTMVRTLLFLLLACVACETTPKPECTTDTDCSSATKPVCKDGKCQADKSCSKDEDCVSGNVCKDNTCQAAPSCPEKDQGGCCEDSHCQNGQTCKDKKCVSPPCTDDEECKKRDASRPKCLQGECTEADVCKTNKDCKEPAKSECKEGKCQAPPRAKIGEECDKLSCEDKLLCYAKVGTPFCREECDPYNPICRGGTVCTYIGNGKGACVPRNNGKLEGESCAGQSCERNLFCVDWTSKICSRICRLDKNDCSSTETCVDFGDVALCVPKPPQCGAGRPCDNDWVCDEKKSQCFPKQCPAVPCNGDEICRVGSCETRNCCKGDPCASGKVCNHGTGKCVGLEIKIPFCTSCLAGGSCGQASQKCIKLSTDDSLCADECTATKTCSDTLMECKEQTGGKWYCIPRAKTCQRDRCDGVTCKAGEACLPAIKACVPVGLGLCKPCEDDLQCGGPTDKCIIKSGEKTGFCGQDCSGCASCPSGYTCGADKQCVPSSGSCQ